ncbi:MAG: LysM peptidoglycan-binding domain-containing protein [Clostridia bacterium]|jgi:LysM repeat protein|nr:LysM peptidoglycan-binding domain-containing protein [Clostridia bacterium]MDD4275398.1 LysM peptidoglycan-binding domain-containing protein [Clostridia bacterium]
MGQEGTISVIKNFIKYNIVHRVINGETLESIAKKYTTTTQIIMQVNKIKSVSVGDRVFIPNQHTAIYIVKPLDTIETIAQKFNVTVDYVKQQSGGFDMLFIGQQIVI